MTVLKKSVEMEKTELCSLSNPSKLRPPLGGLKNPGVFSMVHLRKISFVMFMHISFMIFLNIFRTFNQISYSSESLYSAKNNLIFKTEFILVYTMKYVTILR